MSEWITDRAPTEADADPDGDVLIRRSSTDFIALPWRYVAAGAPYVAAGAPWRRTGIWCQPAPAAEPTPLPAPAAEIPEPIRTGAAQFYAVVVGDDLGSGGGGNPIAWETARVRVGSTLHAVLQHRDRIGSHCGTTYIAECRIIPELTREVPADA